MELFFLRHAQSVNNKMRAETGKEDARVSDPRLTPLGQEQAERLGKFLAAGDPRGGFTGPGEGKGFGITHVYCSLMIRAVETGTAVSRALDLPLQALMEIHEEGGIYMTDATTGLPVGLPGSDRAFFERHFPHLMLPEELPAAGWWNAQPFEPEDVRIPRAQRFVARLLDRHGGTQDRVAMVSHGGFFNVLIKSLLGLPFTHSSWFTTYNCAVSWFHFEEQRVSIEYLNRADFLPAEMIT